MRLVSKLAKSLILLANISLAVTMILPNYRLLSQNQQLLPNTYNAQFGSFRPNYRSGVPAGVIKPTVPLTPISNFNYNKNCALSQILCIPFRSSNALSTNCYKYITSGAEVETKKSVGIAPVECNDSHKTCSSFIQMCHQPLYKFFMKTNCGKSCGFCNQTDNQFVTNTNVAVPIPYSKIEQEIKKEYRELKERYINLVKHARFSKKRKSINTTTAAPLVKVTSNGLQTQLKRGPEPIGTSTTTPATTLGLLFTTTSSTNSYTTIETLSALVNETMAIQTTSTTTLPNEETTTFKNKLQNTTLIPANIKESATTSETAIETTTVRVGSEKTTLTPSKLKETDKKESIDNKIATGYKAKNVNAKKLTKIIDQTPLPEDLKSILVEQSTISPVPALILMPLPVPAPIPMPLPMPELASKSKEIPNNSATTKEGIKVGIVVEFSAETNKFPSTENPTENSACQDEGSKCSDMAMFCKDEAYSEMLNTFCRKTCNLC